MQSTTISSWQHADESDVHVTPFHTLLKLTIVKETKKQQLYLENYINAVWYIIELLHNNQ